MRVIPTPPIPASLRVGALDPGEIAVLSEDKWRIDGVKDKWCQDKWCQFYFRVKMVSG